MNRLSPPQIIILSFTGVIFIGSILLYLPFSTIPEGSMNYIDALFTATSATCVTGLIVKDTGSFFTSFGQAVILLLFQLGGMGIMTFSVLLGVLLGRKLSISENTIIRSTVAGTPRSMAGLGTVVKNIIKLVIFIEAIGAVLLFFRFMILSPGKVGHNIYSSIFHSVSAFCNAGFSIYKNSFMGFSSDIFINLIMSSLIIVGGLGFVVLLSLPGLKLWRRDRRNIWARTSIQTKIVILVSAGLIIAGAVGLFFLEYNNTLFGYTFKHKLLSVYFQSVTSRTAGFNTIPINKLTQPSLFFLIMLMFIGASPGSTGSGIKTTTFAVLIAVAVAMFKNREQVSIFSKTIPREIVREVILVFLFSIAWVTVVTFAVLFSQSLNTDASFIRILFEVISAFSNVGLSTGVSWDLNQLSKIFMIITMLVGRVGPLTLAWAVVLRGISGNKLFYKFPEEKVMVG